MTQDSPKIAFLLGAGASVDAGCPTVYELVDSFREFVAKRGTKPEAAALNFVMDQLRSFEPIKNGVRVLDVELLLSALQLLSDRKSNPMTAFTHSWTSGLTKMESQLPRLLALLEEHIRIQCTVKSNSLDYLTPLRDFVNYYGGLDVFSLNYDTAIEMICQRWDLAYTDGFDAYWNPVLFQSPDYRVRLFKLHGSLLWYVTTGRQRKIVKIPVKPLTQDVEFFSEDSVSSVLIYPTLAKEQHIEPYATLIGQFRRILGSVQVLIAIGCSFRDQYIKRVLLERMSINPSLQLIVVDPHAVQVIKRSDELLTSDLQFASASERILPLPYRAREALQGRRLLEIVRNLNDLASLSGAYEQDVLGGNPDSSNAKTYAKELVEVRHVGTIARAIRGDSPYPEPRSSLWTLATRTDPKNDTGKSVALAILFSNLSPDPSERRVAFDAARANLLRILEYVVWDDGRGSHHVVSNPGGRSFEDAPALTSFFAQHRDRIDGFRSEFEIWARMLPWVIADERVCRGLSELCDDLRKCSGCFDDVVQTHRYLRFDPMGWTERSQGFPRCANTQLLKELGERFGNRLPLSVASIAPPDYPNMHAL